MLKCRHFEKYLTLNILFEYNEFVDEDTDEDIYRSSIFLIRYLSYLLKKYIFDFLSHIYIYILWKCGSDSVIYIIFIYICIYVCMMYVYKCIHTSLLRKFL